MVEYFSVMGYVSLFLTCVVMYKMADIQGRRGWLWVLIGLALVLTISLAMPLLLASCAGLILGGIIMFIANMVNDPAKL